MSKEFEDLVIAKLNKMETFQTEVSTRLDRIEKTLEEHTKILTEHTKTLNEHTKILDEHTQMLSKHDSQIEKNTEQISDLIEVVKYNTSTLVKLDYEIGNKIDVLFDAYKTNHEEYLQNFKSILSLKERVLKQDIRITAVEKLAKKNSKLIENLT